MRLLLIYAVTLCTFFIKGNDAASSVHSSLQYSNTSFSSINSTSLNSTKNTGDTQQLFALQDADNEEDEFSYAKKKIATALIFPVFYNEITNLQSLPSLYSSNRLYQKFCYPSLQKYLFHRAILV
jgi:hypothetical protein